MEPNKKEILKQTIPQSETLAEVLKPEYFGFRINMDFLTSQSCSYFS